MTATDRRLAFSPSPTDDPYRVAGDLPGMDPDATACVFGGPEDAPGRDPRAGIFAFVLDVPVSFPNRRYVASYAATAEERDSRGGSGSRRAGPAAISAWLSEAPLRSADGEGLLTTWWVPWVLAAAPSVERERELLRGVLHHVDREDRRDLDSFEMGWRLGELERLRGASAEEDYDD